MAAINSKPIAFHQRFAAAFDAPVLSKRAIAFILIAGLGLILFWIATLHYLLLQPVLDGKPYPQEIWLHWSLSFRGLANYMIFTFAAGIVGAGVTRRCRWLVGPVLILAATLVETLVTWFFTRHGLQILDYRAKGPLTFYYHFGLSPLMLIPFAAMFIASAAGGLAAPALYRRVGLGLVAAAALAWALTGLASLLLQPGFFTIFSSSVLSGFEVPNYQIFLERTLPYFLGGLWLGWSLRENHLWAMATGLGLMALYRLIVVNHLIDLSGGGWFASHNFEPRIIMPLIGALLGAWLGVILAGARSRRELLRPAVVIVGLIILHIIANQIILRFAF